MWLGTMKHIKEAHKVPVSMETASYCDTFFGLTNGHNLSVNLGVHKLWTLYKDQSDSSN